MTARRNPRTSILYCSDFNAHSTLGRLREMAQEYGWTLAHTLIPNVGTILQNGIYEPDAVISHCNVEATKGLMAMTDNKPHVTLSNDATSELNLPGVVLNHEAAGRLAGHHYVAQGFKNFAVVGHRKHSVLLRRVAGMTEALRSHGYKDPIFFEITSQRLREYGQSLDLVRPFFESAPRPLAVVTTNDQVAVQLMEACAFLDITIPSQVSILGFDNDPRVCELAPVPLSSVDMNHELQASEAAHLLHRLMQGEPAPTSPLFIQPKALIVRQSSGALAAANPTVAKAIAYIHQHLWAMDLSIPEIAETIHVGQTALYVAFQRELSLTPLTYITNMRVERAKSLLRESEDKINEIRPQCGFASDYQMYQAFKRTTGRSPSNFRRKRNN